MDKTINSIHNIEQEIEALRCKLYSCTAENGIRSPLVLHLSEVLDQKIIEYLKMKRGFGI